MKKKEIYEILDGDGNIIGNDDMPPNNPNEIKADGTTDRNAAIHAQHFNHDFLGRFGFYFYNEGANDENTKLRDELVHDIARSTYEHFLDDQIDELGGPFDELDDKMKNFWYDWAKKCIETIRQHLERESEKKVEPTLSESELSKMIEDVITKKSDDKSIVKKGDNDILDDKVKDKIKSLFSNLSDKDKGELIKHLNQ